MTQSTTNVDPLPAGRIAMWLVIAADLMFFVGLIGAFLVLRAGNAGLFADHARGLDKRIGEVEIVTLILSSGMMFVARRAARAGFNKKTGVALLAALVLGVAFIGERTIEYLDRLNHHTIIARLKDDAPLMVIDGDIEWWKGSRPGYMVIAGYAAPLPPNFDIHTISELSVAQLLPQGERHPKEFELYDEPFQDLRYGPGKNIFYAIRYLLGGVHLVHVGVVMIAIAVLLVRSLRGKAVAQHIENVALFWHFVVLIGVVVFWLFKYSA